MTRNDDIERAFRKYGAKAVSDAAYAAMEGRRAAITSIGLGAYAMGALQAITVRAYNLMSDEDRAADLTDAYINGAKLP